MGRSGMKVKVVYGHLGGQGGRGNQAESGAGEL